MARWATVLLLCACDSWMQAAPTPAPAPTVTALRSGVVSEIAWRDVPRHPGIPAWTSPIAKRIPARPDNGWSAALVQLKSHSDSMRLEGLKWIIEQRNGAQSAFDSVMAACTVAGGYELVMCAGAFGTMGDARGVPFLNVLLTEPNDWRLPYEASYALASLGTNAVDALPNLERVARVHWAPVTRSMAANAYGVIGGTIITPSDVQKSPDSVVELPHAQSLRVGTDTIVSHNHGEGDGWVSVSRSDGKEWPLIGISPLAMVQRGADSVWVVSGFTNGNESAGQIAILRRDYSRTWSVTSGVDLPDCPTKISDQGFEVIVFSPRFGWLSFNGQKLAPFR